MSFLLEVCCDNVESASHAVNFGAQRIEFCCRLDLDGLSPTIEDTRQLFDKLDSSHPKGFPVHIMIRCRAGDFVYSATELIDMVEQVKAFKSAFGASPHLRGFVFGCLKAEHLAIDADSLRTIRDTTLPYTLTFHRAFDQLPSSQFSSAISLLTQLRLDRLLTSGGIGNAEMHIDELALLVSIVKQQNSPLVVMIGGGVRPTNVARLVASTGVTEVHSSCVWDLQQSLRELAK